jgi:hypothetical protein
MEEAGESALQWQKRKETLKFMDDELDAFSHGQRIAEARRLRTAIRLRR